MKNLRYLAGLAILLVVCPVMRAQDAPPPSLGDVARKNREEKAKNPQSSKPVLTNDDFFSGHGVSVVGGGAVANTPAPRGQAVVAEVSKKLDVAEQAFQKLDAMNRTELAMVVLKGDARDFPGRTQWEMRLYDAKTAYISHERALAQQLRALMSNGLALEAANIPESDPQWHGLEDRLKAVTAAIQREEATFNLVIAEGRELVAKQPQ